MLHNAPTNIKKSDAMAIVKQLYLCKRMMVRFLNCNYCVKYDFIMSLGCPMAFLCTTIKVLVVVYEQWATQ